jgi:4-amino-4-deoxy-L-arabinose transferase-like glycosyltransferase
MSDPQALPGEAAGPPLWRRLARSSRFWDIVGAIILLAGSLYLFGWRVGSYSLNDPWEPRYPQAVREMIARGDLITPYYEGDIRWTKPILIYWAIYPAVKIFGNNEFSARLPSVLAGALGVLAVYFALLKLRGRATALMAGAILATIPEYFFMARQAMPDMLMTAALAAALSFFALARFGTQRKRLYFGLFYACVGLAFLAKGPVTGVITLGAILLFWLIDLDPKRLFSWKVFSDFRRMIGSYHVLLGVVIFLAVAAPWYLAVWAKHGNVFLDAFFRGENIHRFTEPVKQLRGSSAHYVETTFHGMFPWNSLLPAAIFFLCWGRSKIDEELRQIWYYMAWLLSVFMVFTAAGTKLDHYILPLAVPLAIMVALIWEQYFKEPRPVWIRTALLVSLGFAVLPLRDFLLVGNYYIMDAYTNKHEIENVNVELALKCIHGAWAIVLVSAVLLTRYARVVATFAVLTALGSAIFFAHHVLPLQEQVRSVKHYVVYYQEQGTDESVLVFFGKPRHTVSYYSGGTENYYYRNPNRPQPVVSLARQYPDLYIISGEKYAAGLARVLQRDLGGTWHVLKSGNPDYDLVRPGPKPPPGELPAWAADR